MIALIDADIVAYRCAATAENDPSEVAVWRADRLMRDIIEATKADKYLAFLSGANNFRKDILPSYKANREDIQKPKHLEWVKEYLVIEWKATVADELEADDELGIAQTRYNYVYHSMLLEGQQDGCDQSVICSIDKDLLQIPGKHYNFVKNEFYDVSESDGLRHFYKQMLIGDKADNLEGVTGIGKVKAGKLIDGLKTEEAMANVVCDLYNDADRFQLNADCFWILREEGIMYSDR